MASSSVNRQWAEVVVEEVTITGTDNDETFILYPLWRERKMILESETIKQSIADRMRHLNSALSSTVQLAEMKSWIILAIYHHDISGRFYFEYWRGKSKNLTPMKMCSVVHIDGGMRFFILRQFYSIFMIKYDSFVDDTSQLRRTKAYTHNDTHHWLLL